MGSQRESWQQTFRALGESLIGVLQAELAVVVETWKRSGKELAKVAGLAGAAAVLSLICLPPLLVLALLSGLIELTGWPLWGAALAVAGVVVLVASILGWIAVRVLKHRFESPVATVQHQLSDHRAWWGERVLTDSKGKQGDVDEKPADEKDGDGANSSD